MKRIHMSIVWRLGLLALVLALLGTGSVLYAQSASYDADEDPYSLEKPGGVADLPEGRGIMTGGELWDSFGPQNGPVNYRESAAPIVQTFVRMGNFNRLWTEPTHIWPGGWNSTNFWVKSFQASVFSTDPNFNPAQVGGANNPAHNASDGPQYAKLAYANNATNRVAGAGDPARDYLKEAAFTDATRHYMVYEAAWPTNVGIDVVMKVHQWEINWNNFNDFIIVEYQLTNTGNVDINLDGTVEKTGNVIDAFGIVAHAEVAMSALMNTAGTRSSRFNSGRHMGYVGDNDPSGSPWDLLVSYPGETASGAGDFGLNLWPERFYTDIWSAWTWLGVKQGTNPLGADKTTIFGSHPTGTGAERGWYVSSGQGRGFVGDSRYANAKDFFVAATGTWYVDGGKERDPAKFDLTPNPNYFDAGTPGDVTTFVPKAAPTRPNGSRTWLSDDVGAAAFEVSKFEDAWTKGWNAQANFDGDLYSGIGPFSLGVGETMTVYYAEASGFRLMGVANAINAARYMLANGLQQPFTYPAVPKMKLSNTLNKTVKVSWDNAADTGPGFAGYKIYRANLAKRITFLETGVRGLSEYWRNTTPGPTPENLLQPVNPNFQALDFVAGKVGVPDAWGPYELLKVIPAAELAQYSDNSVPGFNYAYEDPSIELGFQYWFYVSAYTSGNYDLGANWVPYPGTNPATSTTLETSNVNRNGATGTWQGTYPFAFRNSFYPKDLDGLAAIGAGFTVQSALASAGDLVSGAAKVGVKPNPYKKKALFDSETQAADHKVIFYNLPPRATITILDVSGQIIDEIKFESNDPNNGSIFWDLFSKDGIEVASGLYIYVVEYDGGQQVGYLSILR